MNLLIPKLRKLGRECNIASCGVLNFGGCGVYAALVAARLRRLKVPVWGLVGMWEYSCCLDEIRNRYSNLRTVLDWNRAGIIFNHVLVGFELDGTIWTHDSNDTRPGTPDKEWTLCTSIVPGRLSFTELALIALDTDGWNWTFPRECIPTLSKLVQEYLT